MIQHPHQLILPFATEIGGNLGSEILTYTQYYMYKKIEK